MTAEHAILVLSVVGISLAGIWIIDRIARWVEQRRDRLSGG